MALRQPACLWVGLYPCMAICLARGISELAPIDCCVRMGLGPRASKLERGSHNGPCQHQCPHRRMNSKNGYCQCLCPWGKLQLPFASWEAVYDQQVSLTQPPIQLLLLPWIQEHVRLCVHPVRVKSLFPIPLGSPESKSHRPSKPNDLGTQLPRQDPQPGKSDMGLRPLAPWGEPLQL